MCKLKFFLFFLLIYSCTNSNDISEYSVNLNCRKVYWAEDMESVVVAFEILSENNWIVKLDDNKRDIFGTIPKIGDKGFILKNQCSGNEIRLYDFNDSNLILLNNGGSKFYLCSVLTGKNLIDSLKKEKGFYIDYNGEILFTNTNDTLIKSKFKSNNIKISLENLEIEQVTTEKILMGLN